MRIGMVGPYTGASADIGVPILNGIRMAVDEIDARGGYLGRRLELVAKDDAANPDQGRKVSQDLLDEKVVATIGFCNTGVAMKAIDLFQDAKSPLIVPCSSGTAVTAKYPSAASYVLCRGAMRWGRPLTDVVAAPAVKSMSPFLLKHGRRRTSGREVLQTFPMPTDLWQSGLCQIAILSRSVDGASFEDFRIVGVPTNT
ncbi:ABC transporter substrate-binding protein [Acidovorax sp.]|uniref:ABC transporter substrate-binding protein n=1 Tax=Acidovorax sp. TaxID=1872122 RepID=UPI0039187D61